MDIGAILNGHTNELLGLNKNLYNARIKICKKCPLYKINSIVGEICNPKLWVNIKTNEISDIKKDGYVNGCGCRLKAKTTIASANCPLKKW